MSSNIEELPRFHVVVHDSQTYGITESGEILRMPKIVNSLNQGLLIAFYTLLVLFMCCVYCKLNEAIFSRTSWAYLLIPYSTAVVCLGFYLFFLGRAKIRISTASVFCLQSTVVLVVLISAIIQVYLLLLRADGRLDACYATLFIPVYIILLGLLFYAIVILPCTLR
eukprot:TRINITY_DN17063_c0_g1_i2.p2 TRINITY_DN17063_c0_g1~~TRINITY_DN17063_c0_g1_i2.p2  ORF type:complete len:167 (+),score=5.59 TRINITY_DN17063_c0_g1_i2:206-706(+)